MDVVLRRPEMNRTGVYLLVGTSTGSDLPAVHAGEGEAIGERIRSHGRDDDRDYWDRVIAITSKDLNLTKAHVRYLESRLITLLKDARKSNVMNRTDPGFERLPEADVADMETFIEEIQLILPVIGIDQLRRPQTMVPAADVAALWYPSPCVPDRAAEPPCRSEAEMQAPGPQAPVLFSLVHEAKGIRATAVETEGEFVIPASGTGSLTAAPSFPDRIRVLRDQALEAGAATALDDGTFRLAQDLAFKSPSAAAVFLFGTSRNGRTDWLVGDTGQTYGAFKGAQLN